MATFQAECGILSGAAACASAPATGQGPFLWEMQKEFAERATYNR
ncbi:hypothetical protein [Effusibacillus pohliae]|nr:hypothetical protein [Effusibacillus pohliae]